MKHLLSLTFLLLCLANSLGTAVCAAPPALIVILLPGTSLHDWQSAEAPHLHALMQTGTLAVMNTRTAHLPGSLSPETPESALLTLAAGGRAAAPSLRGEDVRNAWPALLAQNRRVGYDLRLGNLSDTLATHGIGMEAGGGPAADWLTAGNSGAVTRAAALTAAPGVCLVWDAGSSVSAADALIGAAAAQMGVKHGRLIVLSPYARAADYAQARRLTPVLAWGPGIPAGLLSSPTTRRPGLVANTDFAPSVAAFFGVPRRAFAVLPFGDTWSAVPAADHERAVERLEHQSVQQAQGMTLLPYLALALGFWMLAATLGISRRPLAGLVLLTPISAVSAALFSVSARSFCAALPMTLTLAWLLDRRLGARCVLPLLSGLITLTLIVDMVSGSAFMRRSLLGYSAVEGARYYGIGNEAMGLLVGAILVVAARVWPMGSRRWAVLGVMLGISLLLGTAGAKAGGLLVSLAAFGTFAYTASGRRWNVRAAVSFSLVVIGGMALAAAGDAFLFPHAHSHIGEAVRRIWTGGGSEAGDIIRRKLNVESRLAYHSAWAVPLWIGTVCIYRLWRSRPASTEIERALRNSGLVGFCTCLALNDAGVVAAALLAVVLWSEAAGQNKAPLPQTKSAAEGPGTGDY